MRGPLRIVFENGEALASATDECACFESGIGHPYLSVGRGPAGVLLVMCD